MLDKYGRLIDDSRDYTIWQELELVFKRDKEFAPLDRAEEKCWQQCGTHVNRTESAGSASLSGPQRDERAKRPRTEVVGEM
jgi:hypothetical protein